MNVMKQYDYKIKTTNSESMGRISAVSEEAAKQVLINQHVPADHNFIDPDGNTVKHELIEVTLTEAPTELLY